MAAEVSPEDVIRFWLGDDAVGDPLAKVEDWWKKNETFDAQIRDRFLTTLERGVRGELADWESTPRGRFALILLYDQLSRNMFRGTARSFGQDALARALASRSFEAGDDKVLAPIEVSFVLMPFMHGEDLALQRRALDGFVLLRDTAADEKLRANFANAEKYSRMHMAIIERFGRFPHRNAILGRASTPEEVEFLKQPGSGF